MEPVFVDLSECAHRRGCADGRGDMPRILTSARADPMWTSGIGAVVSEDGTFDWSTAARRSAPSGTVAPSTGSFATGTRSSTTRTGSRGGRSPAAKRICFFLAY
jgi:hypothetical protein